MAIVAADPAYRRKVILIWVAVTVIGVAGIVWGLPALRRYLEAASPGDALRALRITFIVALASALPMAWSIGRLARRIKTSGRFPPPGDRVIVDTEIVEGEAAQRRARLLVSATWALAAGSLVGMVTSWIAVARLLAGR